MCIICYNLAACVCLTLVEFGQALLVTVTQLQGHRLAAWHGIGDLRSQIQTEAHFTHIQMAPSQILSNHIGLYIIEQTRGQHLKRSAAPVTKI